MPIDEKGLRILVTGGAGFIGSHFCERLLERGHKVVCIDNFDSFYDPELKRKNIANCLSHPHYQLMKGDILDRAFLEHIFASCPFDAVVHLAARAGVRPSIQSPSFYQKVNIEGSLNLLELAARHKIPKFIFASSSSVYGKNNHLPFSESDPVDQPISPYAATKKAGELLAYTYHVLYGISVHCLRFFTVYGPRQRPDMAIHQFTHRIFIGQEIPLYGDGSARRDFTYISDILDGMERSLLHCNGYAIYNLGESRTIDLLSLISLIERALNKKAKIAWMSEQPGDVPVTYADISKAQKELGYSPKVPIEEGIVKFVEWYLKTFGGRRYAS